METQSVNLHVGISSNTSKSRLLEIRGNFYFSCRALRPKYTATREFRPKQPNGKEEVQKSQEDAKKLQTVKKRNTK